MTLISPETESKQTGPLAIPIFRNLWLSTLVSNFGGMIQSVGAAWMMAAMVSSPQLIALVQASTAFPILLLSLLAGAIADSVDRRKVMIVSQAFMLLVSTVLALFAWLQWLSPGLLLAFTFLIGCGTAINGPAWQASVGEIVPRRLISQAVSLNGLSFNLARTAGPATGGIIVSLFGASFAFLCNMLSYVGLLGVLLRWNPQKAPQLMPPERLDIAVATGLRYVQMSPNIHRALIRSAFFGFGASAVPALMPLVARDLLGGGPLVYGMLLGAFGLGAVCGAFLGPVVRLRLSTEAVVRYSSLAAGWGAVTVALSPMMIFTMAGLLIAGTGWVLCLSTINVSCQLAAPRWVVARVLAVYQMSTFGGIAAGSWLFGGLAASSGIVASLVIAGCTQLVGILIGYRMPLARLGFENLDPLGPWSEPGTDVAVQADSGPIMVTVEYRIPPANVEDFLAAMVERRRIRRRDGALDWHLMQDLGDAMLWSERYRVSTWLDYLRHVRRRTEADRANLEHIRACHQGPELPVIRRFLERRAGVLPIEQMVGSRELTDPNQSV